MYFYAAVSQPETIVRQENREAGATRDAQLQGRHARSASGHLAVAVCIHTVTITLTPDEHTYYSAANLIVILVASCT